MKAILDENGVISIYPMNGLEAFALRQWVEQVPLDKLLKINIVTNVLTDQEKMELYRKEP